MNMHLVRGFSHDVIKQKYTKDNFKKTAAMLDYNEMVPSMHGKVKGTLIN